ncbi:hypothetical protein D1007_56959 [Hordeum vulgare]|nr:hypothetical protein D1007_56959 [Hordeum vulgare]
MQTDVRDMSKFFDESFDCAPVPLARFNDTQLLSDYNLLEETSLVRELAHRLLGDFGGNFGRNFEGCSGAKLPPSLVALRKAAERRSVRLFFLPHGMTRRAQNRSWHDNRWQWQEHIVQRKRMRRNLWFSSNLCGTLFMCDCAFVGSFFCALALVEVSCCVHVKLF